MNYWRRVLKHTIKIVTFGCIVVGLAIGIAWLAIRVSVWILIVFPIILAVAIAMFIAEREAQ